jgi:hypothetical protein
LKARVDAANRLQTAHGLQYVGGTEQLFDAVGAWCKNSAGITPSWMAAPDPAAAVSRDVRTIIGGMFSVDHLGPEAFHALQDRATSSASEYLDALDVIVASSTPDVLSVDWPSELLDLTRHADPVHAERSAKAALSRYEDALSRDRAAGSAGDATRQYRLEQRISSLRQLAHSH